MTTKFQKHKAAWEDCKRCPLWKTRTHVVLVRGQLPADVLCVGEAPGLSEDVLGSPFVGPAGKLLDAAIKDAKESVLKSVRVAFTNLVACIPLGDDGDKTAEPDHTAVAACAPRLREMIEIVKPSLIVCVGKLAEDYLYHNKNWTRKAGESKVGWKHPQLGAWKGKIISVVHPASILRSPYVQRSFAVQKMVLTLASAFEDLIPF